MTVCAIRVWKSSTNLCSRIDIRRRLQPRTRLMFYRWVGFGVTCQTNPMRQKLCRFHVGDSILPETAMDMKLCHTFWDAVFTPACIVDCCLESQICIVDCCLESFCIWGFDSTTLITRLRFVYAILYSLPKLQHWLTLLRNLVSLNNADASYWQWQHLLLKSFPVVLLSKLFSRLGSWCKWKHGWMIFCQAVLVSGKVEC